MLGEPFFGTNLGLFPRIFSLALDEYRHVVLVELWESIVGHTKDADGTDLETRLLQRLALDAREEILTLLKVPAWKTPLTFIAPRVSVVL